MKAYVYFKNTWAGVLSEAPDGSLSFVYTREYLKATQLPPISLSLPKTNEAYTTPQLHPFFDALLPEGWWLDLAAKKLKLNPYSDRLALLIALGQDVIGAVSIRASHQLTQPRNIRPKSYKHKNKFQQKFKRCLYCYKTLNLRQESLYHAACCMKIFGRPQAPVLDFDSSHFDQLAQHLGLQENVVQAVYRRAFKASQKWPDNIDASYLSPDLKLKYQHIIRNKIKILNL